MACSHNCKYVSFEALGEYGQQPGRYVKYFKLFDCFPERKTKVKTITAYGRSAILDTAGICNYNNMWFSVKTNLLMKRIYEGEIDCVEEETGQDLGFLDNGF